MFFSSFLGGALTVDKQEDEDEAKRKNVKSALLFRRKVRKIATYTTFVRREAMR
jgi:hypothetical protein